MDVVDAVASIAQLFHVTTKTIKYLNSVRKSSDERSRLFLEAASNLLPLLVNLESQARQASNSEEWFRCVRFLAVENGPVEELREALEQLATKIKSKKGLKDPCQLLSLDVR